MMGRKRMPEGLPLIASMKDPVSSLTHFAGALLSVAGLVVLEILAIDRGTVWHVVSVTIFAASLIMLYTASGVYHAVRAEGTPLGRVLRTLDHSMIFVLIAGTYTPFCLLPLRGVWGWSLFGAIWGCALAGIIMKLVWLHAPRWLYTSFYVIMGWLVVVAAYPLVQRAPAAAVIWLLAGGIAYTLGAVLYATKWPKLWPGVFGFHEVWHLFVMAGSACHYLAVYYLI